MLFKEINDYLPEAVNGCAKPQEQAASSLDYLK